MKFEGTDSYVTTRGLTLAVNAANVLQRPLLIKGEPGTGKTLLAEEVARALNMPLFQWHIKSTTKAQQDSRIRCRFAPAHSPGDPRVEDIAHYIVPGVLWQAFDCDHDRRFDRRDRQGRHRVSQRPAARTRPHGILLLRTPSHDQGAPPATDHHYLEQRERAAGRLPAPLLLSLHQVSRQADDDAYRRRPFPGPQARLAARGAGSLLRPARGARPQRSRQPANCSTG